MNLVHVFRNSDDVERQLPFDPPANRPGWEAERVQGFAGKGIAPGGWGGGSGVISEREALAFPAIYRKDTLWLVYDLDDSRNVPTLTRPTWAGLLRTSRPIAGKMRITADGLAGKAERNFDARLWEDRTCDNVATGDTEPYDLDTDDQIEVKIRGEEVVSKVAHGAQFKRAHGRTALKEKAEAGADSITVRNNWGGLTDGENITIGGEVRVVANSYDPDSTTIPLTAPLAAAHDKGAIVTWNAPGTPVAWSTPVVYAEPGESIEEVELRLDSRHPTDTYTLRVHRFTYPDAKARVLVDTIDLGGGMDAVQTVAIPGNSDGLTYELRRTTETRKARGYKLVLKHRVRARATSSDYRTDQVVVDVANSLGGGDLSGIGVGGRAAMPLIARNESAATVLDYCGVLDDRYWLRFHDGTQYVWEYHGPATRTWNIVDPRFPRNLETVRQYSHARGPYRSEGNQIFHTRVEATPAPDFLDVYPVDYDKPPPFDTAVALLGAIADEVARERYFGEMTFTEVVDPATGITWPASVVRPGDRARIVTEGNLLLRMTDMDYLPDKVRATFPDGYPQVDKLLAVRSLLMQRGRSNKQATLVGLDLAEPDAPGDSELTFIQQDSRGKDYKARIEWVHNEFTVDGDPTVLRAHHVRLRRCTALGAAVDDKVLRKRVPVREDEDDARGDSSDKDDVVFFDRIDEPGSWYQYRIAAEGMVPRGKRGPWGPGDLETDDGWSDPQQVPTVAEVETGIALDVIPNAITLDVDQHKMTISVAGSSNIYSASDPEKLKRGIDHFIYQVATDAAFANIVKRHQGKVTTKTWKHSKPGSGTYYGRAYLVDGQDNKRGPTSTASNARGVPPAPTSAPSIVYTRGGKKGIRAVVTAPAYAGVYADDDIGEFIVQLQAEESNPVDGDQKRPVIIDLEPGEQTSAQVAIFEKIKAGEKVRARYLVRDTKGHKSTAGPWSSISTAAVTRKPAAVNGLTKDVDEDGKFKTISWRWDAPTLWSDGNPIGSEDEIAGYNVTPIKAGVDQANKAATMHKSTRYQIRAPAGSGPWTLRVEPVGWDGTVSAAATSTDGVTASGFAASDIPTDSIAYDKLASTLGGLIVGSYGAASTTGVSPNIRSYLPGGPTGYKQGDMLLNLGETDGKPRLYKLEGSTWYRAVEGPDITTGSLVADKIIAGTLQGVAFITASGGYFQTGLSGLRIRMDDTAADAIRWLDSGGSTVFAMSANSSGFMNMATAAASLGYEFRIGATLSAEFKADGVYSAGTKVSVLGHGHSLSGTTGTQPAHSHSISSVSVGLTGRSGSTSGHDHGPGDYATVAHGHGGATLDGGSHDHSVSVS